MLSVQSARDRVVYLFRLIMQALKGEQQDYTSGSIRKAVFMLSLPMILEMMMESVFAVVDIFFVGRLGKDATSTVGITESVMTMVYSVAIGLSMAATAMVARRIGEKDPENASRAAGQAMLLSLILTLILSVAGVIFSKNILLLMSAPPEVIVTGTNYMRMMFGGCIVIMLLFLINGIFRGAGDAAIAMRSLWLANICNIIFCPLMIYGIGPWDGWGLTGAAIATTSGRGIGVLYQLWHLFRGKGMIRIRANHFIPDGRIIRSLLNIAWTATLQFVIGSASWIVLARLIAGFGSTAMAGYTVAIRVVIFFILPAWGMSNAAATLVGQNLGAQRPDRAEAAVWKTARYSAGFMFFVSLIFLIAARPIVAFMNSDPAVIKIAVEALRIISVGYVFYGVGMVVTNAFNGAGDSKTPTWINFFGFWMFQIPLAYLLSHALNLGLQGIFFAIITAESMISVAGVIIFRRGKWKLVKI